MTKSRDLANAATALNAVTAAELGYVDGVTSAIQTQLDAKLATATAASTYVPNSLADAKGDLLTATADNTPARLAVGNNGDTIVADSSTSSGLRYQAPVNVNPVLNSAFQIWQRGTSIAATGTGATYGADRWQPYRNAAGGTMSRQVTGDTTNLPFIQYCARIARDSGNTSTTAILLDSTFESVNSIPYAGKTVTFSFYARAGANYSATSSALVATLLSGTGTDQNSLSGFTGSANVIQQTATLTTTWQRFTYSATVGTTATQLGMRFSFTPTGTAGANDYYEVTGVQLEVGSVATPFKTYAGTIQGETSACQRYYFQTAPLANRIFTTGQAYATTLAYGSYNLPVTMRSTPSVSFSAAGDFDLFNATGSRLAVTALAGNAPNVDNIRLDATVASGLVAGNATVYIDDAAGNAVIKVSAEL